MPRAKNLSSSLPGRRRKGSAMQAYDALPPELRQWMSTAALPWSPASVRRIWVKAGGAKDPQRALSRLSEVEAATLRKDSVPVDMVGAG